MSVALTGRRKVADNERFLRNAADARENGYDLVCSACGCGMTDEEFEGHDTGCPNAGRDRDAEMAMFLAERLGGADREGVPESVRRAAEALSGRTSERIFGADREEPGDE